MEWGWGMENRDAKNINSIDAEVSFAIGSTPMREEINYFCPQLLFFHRYFTNMCVIKGI